MLSRSIKHKVVVTCGAILGFALFREASTLDSQIAAIRQATGREHRVVAAPGLQLRFEATAYCRGETTAAGLTARTGIVAADPEILPVGSVVQVDSLGSKYNGIYTVMDTGPQVEGSELDIYMWNCDEAVRFGRRAAQIRVLRLGWNPRNSDKATPQRSVSLPPRPTAASATPGL